MKKIFSIIFTGIMCLSLIAPLTVNGEGGLNDPDLLRLVDDADLISDVQEEFLNDKIKTLTDKYDFDIVIVTTNTLDGLTPMEYADDYYDYTGYGAGEENDGVLLLVSMENRDWWLSTTGYGITVFTDYGIERIGDLFVPYLSDNDYYGGFTEFLDLADDFISEANSNIPYDVDHTYATTTEGSKTSSYATVIVISAIVALFIAIIVSCVLKGKMRSVVMQQNANNYKIKDSFKLERSNDVFLYKTVSKTKKAESSSSGGSSTHSSSSGTTHGGGGGSF